MPLSRPRPRHAGTAAALLAVLASLALAAAAPARAGQAPPTPSRFIVETDCPTAQRAFLEHRLDAFGSAADVLIGALMGAPPPRRPVRLRVFCDRARYTAFTRAHAPRRAANGGYFDGATRTVVTYRRGNPPQVLLHEVAHALLHDAWGALPAGPPAGPTARAFGGRAPAAIPPWLDEGLAEYLSSYAIEPSGVRFGAPHAARLATLLDTLDRGRWLPVRALVAAHEEAFTGADMARHYAAAWGLVDLLVGDPALRARLPALISALRAGQSATRALTATYPAAPDALAALDTRLRARVATLAAPAATPAVALAAQPLGEWTEHGQGRWRVSPQPPDTPDTLIGAAPQAWSYLTRAVSPRRALVLTGQVRRDAGAVGLALGGHRARGYAYHTLIELGPDGVSLQHPTSRQAVEGLARAGGPTPLGQWVPLRVEVAGGTVAVWRDGALALTAPLPAARATAGSVARTPEAPGPGLARPGRAGAPWVSLVGVYVREGRGAFRGLRLGAGGAGDRAGDRSGLAHGPSAAASPAGAPPLPRRPR